MSIELQVTEECLSEFRRLDQWISSKVPSLSRSTVKRLFLQQAITAKDSLLKLELKSMPPVGSQIIIEEPEPLPAEAQAENIPLQILFEDEHLVIVNKEAGMVTHPAPGNYTGTLVNAILHHCTDLKGVGDQKRPGIVHRLDKGTSGVMVVAKTQACHEGLVSLFSNHDIDRVYQALAMTNKVPVSGKLESLLGRHPQNRLKMAVVQKGGKSAITHYKVIEQFEKFSHMQLKLETGRTHQIRVHLSSLLNAPILCDPLYGNPKEHLNRLGEKFRASLTDYPHPFLHAKRLGFIHPITKEDLLFETPPPETFQEVLRLASD